MRYLVTGATGHLGAHLVRALLAQATPGTRIFVMVRPGGDLWRLADVVDQVEIITSDMDDLNTGAITAARAETVFHLAWHNITAQNRDDTAHITRNITTTLNLFEAVRAAGCRCWVGVGSLAEYGPYPHTLTEDLHPQPITAYGTAKLCLGLLTARLCETAGMRHLWFRMTGTYGPMDQPQHLIPSVITQLLAGQKPALTLGEQQWDYLYITDAAAAIAQAAALPDATGIFNLGSGRAHSVRQIVEVLRDMIDPALPLGFGMLPYSPQQIMHLEADITRLRERTGWQPRISLEAGLQQTVAWHRAQAGGG